MPRLTANADLSSFVRLSLVHGIDHYTANRDRTSKPCYLAMILRLTLAALTLVNTTRIQCGFEQELVRKQPILKSSIK